MNRLTDQQLLREYAERRAEPAFAELVRRHVDLVYSAALRMVCDAHLAQDVAQGTFIALAQNAPQLADRQVLSGWLHCTARNLASKTVRSEVRRRIREQEAAAMNELLAAEPDNHWEYIAPHLDAGLGELNEADREAVMLRYFERKSAREMAQTLGTSEDAAQKRVSRAVERLREFFARRGVTVGASALAVALSANAVQAAPVGLAVTISAAAALTGAAIATTATVTATKAILMTTLQKTLLAVPLIAACGIGIYEARQAAQLRQQVQVLETRQRDEVRRLRDERDEAAARLAALSAQNELLRSNAVEVAKLRSEVAGLRAQERESAKSRTPPPQESDAPASSDIPSGGIDLPKETWANVGFGTPQAALQTRGWAVLNGDRQRFAESVFITDGARKLVEDKLVQMASASTDPEKESLIQEAINNKWGVEEAMLMPMMALDRDKGFTDYRILSQRSVSADERILEVETGMASAAAKQETLKFRRFGNDWKVVIDEDAVRSQP